MHFISPDVLTSSGMHLQDQYSAHWYAVAGTNLVHKTLGELDLYRRTGATVAAVRRGDIKFPYPEPDLVLMEEDELYAIGTGEQLGFFEQLFEPHRIIVPSYE